MSNDTLMIQQRFSLESAQNLWRVPVRKGCSGGAASTGAPDIRGLTVVCSA